MTPENRRSPVDAIVTRTRQFYKLAGRRPRILVARTAAPDTDREMKGLSAALADMGFDVDIYGPLRSPLEAAAAALENDVHLIGVVGAGAGRYELLRSLVRALADLDAQEILVAAWRRPTSAGEGGGRDGCPSDVILFDPEQTRPEAVDRILDTLESRR